MTGTRRKKLRLAFGVVTLALALAALDTLIEQDDFDPADAALDLFEKLALAGGLAWIASMAVELKAEQEELRADLGEAVAQGEAWRREVQEEMEGLSAAVGRQFRAWGLTDAEAEIAALMLKGMPLKGIARARGTTETTIRQQASQVYRKSGLRGRAELSAYFLHSLAPHERMGVS